MRKVANLQSRNVGIDVLKVVACFLVVSLHTINSTFGLLHRIIISTSVIAIPIFFTTSGLFMLGKESVSYSYIFRKIKGYGYGKRNLISSYLGNNIYVACKVDMEEVN